MPRLYSVQSLKTVCLISIARNMDNLWCADLIRNPNATYSYLIGPFEYFTSDLLASLVDILVNAKMLKRPYLPLLVNNHVTSLDLTPWFKYNIQASTVYNLVKTRCQRLTHLKLNHKRVPSEFLLSALPLLPSLVSLDLSHTRCSDENLLNISTSCRNLQILKLGACSAITDSGISSLCRIGTTTQHSIDAFVSASFGEQEPLSSKIAYLDISYTNITDVGVRMALENLPSLQHLECADASVALYRMLENHYAFHSPLRTYPLRLLKIEIPVDAEGVQHVDAVGAACTLCPAAVEVQVSGRAANQAVVVLARLEHLQKLSVSNLPGQPICFQAGLLSLLQISGANLTSLDLHDVNGVDFDLIAACCRNLVALSCVVTPATKHPFTASGFPAPNIPDFRPFATLEEIELNLVDAVAQCPAQFLSLLLAHSTRIRVIRFTGLDKLSDDVIVEALTTNPLRYLQVLQLISCSEVTFASVQRILELPNELTCLVLTECFNMSNTDYHQCMKTISGKNYDLIFQWS